MLVVYSQSVWTFLLAFETTVRWLCNCIASLARLSVYLSGCLSNHLYIWALGQYICLVYRSQHASFLWFVVCEDLRSSLSHRCSRPAPPSVRWTQSTRRMTETFRMISGDSISSRSQPARQDIRTLNLALVSHPDLRAVISDDKKATQSLPIYQGNELKNPDFFSQIAFTLKKYCQYF